MYAGSPEHTIEGHSYFVKESYEELLWWLQLPALCKLAAQAVPARSGFRRSAWLSTEATSCRLNPRGLPHLIACFDESSLWRKQTAPFAIEKIAQMTKPALGKHERQHNRRTYDV